MKGIYLKWFKGNIRNLSKLKLASSYGMSAEEAWKKEGKVLVIQEASCILGTNKTNIKTTYFKIDNELPREKDEQGRDKIVTVAGYVETTEKVGVYSRVKNGDNNLMASLYGFIPVLREMPKNYKAIGYIKIQDSDTYIALIKKKIQPLPIIAPVAALAITAFLMSTPSIKSPISLDKFTQGNVGQGEIALEKSEMKEAQNIRIIMNVNPVLEDGSMNLMIQNSEESNTLSMVAEVQLIDKRDQAGNIIENYKKPLVIAETPLIRPGENIEDVQVNSDVQVEAGYYDGRVLYTAYEITDEGAMPIGQVAGRINLVVK